MVALAVLVVLTFGLLPLLLLVLMVWMRREVRELRERLEDLERSARRLAVSEAAARPAPERHAAPASSPGPAAPAPVMAAAPASLSPAAAPWRPAPTGERRPRIPDPTRLEQQIGGIWLQNIGSVLLLLGAFFLIVWGYATGRIGPGILVLAGVALGIVISWRGTLIARTLLALGNAFVGVGLGVVYITLYVGHFRMGVMPGSAAFILLGLVSMVTVGIGLRRREPVIATLGVLGAFLPQFLAAWIPLHGFHLPLPTLLGYFAVVNAVVLALAATQAWSGLVILSLVLTSWTWGWNAGLDDWGLWIQLALAGLFTALGLAPVASLARSPRAVRGIDLAVVAIAPMLLLVSSLPFLAAPDRVRAAALLAGLGVVYAGAALWVDARRAPRDLWRPLTAAAALFGTAAIERGLVPENLALAWCVEGAALVWLGLLPRAAWLRLLGYGVLFLAGLRLLGDILGGAQDASLLSPPALRDLLTVGVFLTVAHLLGRGREVLDPRERVVPGLAAWVSNLLLAVWLGREAGRVRASIPLLAAPGRGEGSWAIASVAWLAHSLALLVLAARRSAPVLRDVAYGLALLAVFSLLGSLSTGELWRTGPTPLVNPVGIILALDAALLLAAAELLGRKDRLRPSEREMSEIATVIANLVLLIGWAREAGHLATATVSGGSLRATSGEAVRTLAAVYTSTAWTLQAILLFALGWIRGSAFLRWSGLGLFGVTVVKFLVIDLERVDAFWRFVSAIGIGVALLTVSFLYQRRSRRSAEAQGR